MMVADDDADVDVARRALPVWAARQYIVREASEHRSVVIMSETGSGKTTQIPQFLHAAGFSRRGAIAVTQPRRVAAITVAQRVAAEMRVPLGGLVGYTVRFDDRSSRRETRIRYITDGMLLREALQDPLLGQYACVVLDEVHERSVQTDILCAVAKGAQAARAAQPGRAGPLTLIVMSATLDMAAFSAYFGGAPCLHIRGRSHPVAVYYSLAPVGDYVEAVVTAALQVHAEEAGFALDGGVDPELARARGDGGDGDILIFLTGQEEIEAAARLIGERCKRLPPHVPALLPCPMYAALSPAAQLRALDPAPAGVRKAILATTIAETSLTVPGVRYVVDCGLTKARVFHAAKGVDTLQVVPVSKAAARQRAGRAGRERAGKCFRLYTEAFFHGALDESAPPEILRTNVSTVVLQLKAMRVRDVFKFDYVDAPPREALMRALESLLLLGALDVRGEITELGSRMARFPLDPPYARALLAAREHACVGAMLTLTAAMSVDGSFFVGGGGGRGRGADDDADPAGAAATHAAVDAARARFASQYGDLLTRVHACTAAHEAGSAAEWCHAHGLNRRSLGSAQRIRKQLCGLWARIVGPLDRADAQPAPLDDGLRTSLRRALTVAFFTRAALKQPSGHYLALASHEEVAIHPSSCLFHRRASCVLFQELVHTTRRYIRELTVVEAEWLRELAPHGYFQVSDDAGAG